MVLWYFLPKGRTAGPDIVARGLLSALPAALADAGIEWATVCEDDADAATLEATAHPIPFHRALAELSRTKPVLHIPRSPLVSPNRRFRLFRGARRSGLPIVANIHGDPWTEARFARQNGELGKALGLLPSAVAWERLVRAHDALVVNSRRMASLVHEALASADTRLEVIPNGIGPWWLERRVTPWERGGAVVSHGRIAAEKGVWEILQAASRLRAELEEHRIVLAGEGPLLPRLRRWVGRHGLAGIVQLPGGLSSEGLFRMLATARGSVYPSRYEPFSLAALEALACANGPVYLSSEVGLTEFLDADTFGPQTFRPTVEGTVATIRRIVASGDATRVVRAQQASAADFLWERIAPRYVRLYRELGA